VVDLPRLAARVAATFRRDPVARTLRRVLGLGGTVLLGGALAWAPIAAFTGEMLAVTKVGLTGVALLIAMKLLPGHDATPEHPPDHPDDER
jgi:hypothetical protein